MGLHSGVRADITYISCGLARSRMSVVVNWSLEHKAWRALRIFSLLLELKVVVSLKVLIDYWPVHLSNIWNILGLRVWGSLHTSVQLVETVSQNFCQVSEDLFVIWLLIYCRLLLRRDVYKLLRSRILPVLKLLDRLLKIQGKGLLLL